MKEKQAIKLIIANQECRMQINKEEEKRYRNISDYINIYFRQVKQSGIQSDQHALALVCVEFAKRCIELDEESKQNNRDIESALDRLMTLFKR